MKYLTILLLLPALLFGLGGLEAGESGPVPLSRESLSLLPKEEGYSFSRLGAKARLAYKEVLWTLVMQEKGTAMSTTSPELLDTAFNAVKNDHPELFYVDGYSYIHVKRGGEILSMAFFPEYNREFKEILYARREIEKRTEEFLRETKEGDYQLVKQAYDYILTHTEYDEDALDSQNICSVFLEGESVCTGYARALQYLLEKQGIPAVMLTGTVRDGQPHAWLAVRLEGEYYHIDPTWGDSSYQIAEETAPEVSSLPEVSYDYFLVTDGDIEHTHSIDNVVEAPVCNSLRENYYVREGAYFVQMDTEKLGSLFERYYARGEEYLTLKCADSAVYREMKSFLLGDQHIFDYLRERDAVAYADKPEICSLSFWL